MRAVPIIGLTAVALFSILARNFVGKFMYAFAHEIPVLKVRKREFQRAMAIFSLGFGILLLVIAILMASGVIFPW